MNTIAPTPTTETRERRSVRPALRRLHLDIVDGAAVIVFDHPEKSANVIDGAFLDEFERALNAVSHLRPRGLVLSSSKPAVFVAGADLAALGGLRGERLAALGERGQRIFGLVEDLGIPTVAAIHGACLGGGLELALACDCRIASGDSATKLGLPETQLGILPAWGGCTRLPSLVGLPAAIDLVVSGRQLKAKQALRLGLVDEVVPRERLVGRALALLDEAPARRRRRLLTNNPLSAGVLRRIARRRLLAKTRGLYPAPLQALEVVSRGAGRSARARSASLARERDALVRLAETGAARQLMRLFFLVERAKRFRHDPTLDAAALAPVRRTAVVGAGVMGAGIAQAFASRDFPVVLSDIDRDRVAAGARTVGDLFAKAAKRRIFSAHEARRKLDLVFPTAEAVPLRRCDLVVEAVVENLGVKRIIFADLCERTAPDTILATNTSALPVTDLATAPGVTHPERVVGLHFFNPVSRMKLVEIVTTEFTSPETVERTLAFVRGLGKTPVVVKDSPGFLVNRILMPYLIEAGRMAAEGLPVAEIDAAMLDFGMPMGPLRLLDEIGLDVAAHVAATMGGAFGERLAPPALLDELVRHGHLGRKTGLGFYRHGKGGETARTFAGAPARLPGREEIAARLDRLMVEEARRCLDEGIAADADTIDLAMILGAGYAPFRGGPLAASQSRS